MSINLTMSVQKYVFVSMLSADKLAEKERRLLPCPFHLYMMILTYLEKIAF